jgi:hypothetical protein
MQYELLFTNNKISCQEITCRNTRPQGYKRLGQNHSQSSFKNPLALRSEASVRRMPVPYRTIKDGPVHPVPGCLDHAGYLFQAQHNGQLLWRLH